MRKLLEYVAVTVALLLCGLAVLLYIRSGGKADAPVWPGGQIRVGYSTEAPYSFRTADGTVTGMAPEMAKAVLRRAGIEPVRWVLLDFSQAIPALLAGRIDMIANGLFITPERGAQVLFSLPFASIRPGLLVRRNNPLRLHSYADVASRVAATAAVLDGSVEQLALVRLGKPMDRLFVVPDPAGGLAAVLSGRADCLALTAPTVAWLAAEAGGEAESASPFQGEGRIPVGESAFAFRQQDRALARRVNAALQDYIGTPRHSAMAARFGFGPESMPSWVR